MNKILIELILTNQCNKRCEYCDLDFQNKSLSFNDLNLFIEFINKNKANYTINFFWWEPLLEYEKLIYIVEKTDLNVSNFSIWTNWILLNKEKLDYFKKNNFKIYLSIDNISLWKDLDLDMISKYKDIININFINDPYHFSNSLVVFNNIIKYWFNNIAFMPVFNTKKWDKKSLIELKKIYGYISNNIKDINFETYSYFNWVAVDKQFILDTDLFFYSDLDSLLWLQKQYKNIDSNLKNKIYNKTKLLSLKSDKLTLKNLLNLYNIKEVLNLVFEIPKLSWDFFTYKIIDNILKNGTEKR